MWQHTRIIGCIVLGPSLVLIVLLSLFRQGSLVQARRRTHMRSSWRTSDTRKRSSRMRKLQQRYRSRLPANGCMQSWRTTSGCGVDWEPWSEWTLVRTYHRMTFVLPSVAAITDWLHHSISLARCKKHGVCCIQTHAEARWWPRARTTTADGSRRAR